MRALIFFGTIFIVIPIFLTWIIANNDWAKKMFLKMFPHGWDNIDNDFD